MRWWALAIKRSIPPTKIPRLYLRRVELGDGTGCLCQRELMGPIRNQGARTRMMDQGKNLGSK
jgi:hypothetical protein